MKINGKLGKLIEELSEGRTEITTKMICDAQKLYFIRKRTLADGKLPDKAKSYARRYADSFDAALMNQYEQGWKAAMQPNRGFFGQPLGGVYGSLLG